MRLHEEDGDKELLQERKSAIPGLQRHGVLQLTVVEEDLTSNFYSDLVALTLQQSP